MMSRDDAAKVADALLHPARKDLEVRRDRLEARQDAEERFKRRRASAILPAGIAALAAVVAVDLGAATWLALVAGTVTGWAFGVVAQRDSGRHTTPDR